MIVSFGSKQSEKIWRGQWVSKFPLAIQAVGRRKLRMINNSIDLADLRIPPVNRLEKLSGDLKGFIAFASTTSGELFLNGLPATHTKLKL